MSKIFIVALDTEKVSEPKGSDTNIMKCVRVGSELVSFAWVDFHWERALRGKFGLYTEGQRLWSDGAGSEVSGPSNSPMNQFTYKEQRIIQHKLKALL